MCGLFFSNEFDSQFHIENIRSELSKRGVDDFNWLLQDGYIFAHSRLSITGDEISGSQPCKSERIIVLFNGQIYNFLELANEFDLDVSLKTSDTEVLFGIVKKHCNSDGINLSFLQKINGFYSIIIYDSLLHCVYLARDGVGKKPLYYKNVGKVFSASSRARLLTGSNVILNTKKISKYINYGEGLIDSEHWFSGVKVLAPGACIRVNLKSLLIEELNLKTIDKQDNRELKEVISSAINLRARTDKRISVALSSGVDSTIIAAYLKNQNIDFDYASVGFNPIEKSEVPKAFQKLGLINGEVRPILIPDDPQQIENLLSEAIDALEIGHSSSAIIPYAQMCKEIKLRGSKVLIEGQGADELFLGYEKYLLYASIYSLKSINLINFATNIYSFIKLNSLKMLILEILRIIFPKFTYLQTKRWSANKILSQRFRASKKDPRYKFIEDYDQFIQGQLRYNLVNLLHYGDAIPLYFGIENRNPFCDKDLRSYVLKNLTLDDMVNSGITKRPLRDYSLNELGLYQPMESKVGFFTTAISSLRLSKNFCPHEVFKFLKSKNIIDKDCSEKLFEKIPDNIYFRMCCVKASLEQLISRGCTITS